MARVGKYELLDLVGKGGMGEVWRARDESLGRIVALKLLQRGGPEDLARFRREARVVARLSHPHIAQLFEVGDDPPHIAMQFVSGVPIHRVPLTLSAKAKALAEAARAVQHAHEQGVIHRDLKPANVLVDEAGRGVVLDFGLAREVRGGASSMSLTGDILGTPQYMAPEQARGDVHAIDPRTDVYGLGATLYALITGRSPFGAETVFEVIDQVLREDPPRPRGDRDLETICLKAMEKEPARRYASAAEFAGDLDRYLAGEPVSARRASLPYRLHKRIRRRPALYGLGAALWVVVAIAAGAQWLTGRQHGTRIEEERLRRYRTAWGVLRPLAAQVDGLEELRNAFGVPPPEMEPVLRPILEQAEALIRDQPDFGPAVAWHAKGLELLGRTDDADREYDRACALSAESAEAWYLRGMRRVERYHTRRGLPVFVAGAIQVDFLPLPPETEEERELRESALADLRRLEELSALDPEFAERKARLGRAAMLLYANRYEEAIAELQGREGPREWRIRGLALYHLKQFEEAMVEFDRLVAAWPGLGQGWFHRGLAAYAAALCRSARGEDPREVLRAARSSFDEAVARPPGSALAWSSRGNAAWEMGQWNAAHGIDPMPDYDAALADHDGALERDPGSAGILSNRGGVRVSRGRWLSVHGQDPVPDYEAAIRDFGDAIAMDASMFLARLNRACARIDLGQWRAWRNQDPTSDFLAAIEDLEHVLSRQPDNVLGLSNRGNARRQLGAWRDACGQDPLEDFRAALSDYARLAELHPAAPDGYLGRSGVLWDRATWGRSHGEDPTTDLEAAISEATEAVSRKADLAEGYSLRGEAQLDLGRWRASRGEDPLADFAAAEEDFTRALEHNPGYADAYDNRAEVRAERGNWRLIRGADPEADYEAAAADYAAALARNPRHAGAFLRRGVALARLAGWLARHPSAARRSADAYRRAAADFEACLDLVPEHPQRAAMRSEIARFRAEAERLDPAPEFR